jgi:hypothetical protein
VTLLEPGVSLSIPFGTQFQFRCDGSAPLDIVAVTMPPWPAQTKRFLSMGNGRYQRSQCAAETPLTLASYN